VLENVGSTAAIELKLTLWRRMAKRGAAGHITAITYGFTAAGEKERDCCAYQKTAPTGAVTIGLRGGTWGSGW